MEWGWSGGGGSGGGWFAPLPDPSPPPQDQAARAVFIATRAKVPGFFDALARDVQFAKAVARTVLEQAAADQAFAAELYAGTAAFLEAQAAKLNSPQCKLVAACFLV